MRRIMDIHGMGTPISVHQAKPGSSGGRENTTDGGPPGAVDPDSDAGGWDKGLGRD